MNTLKEQLSNLPEDTLIGQMIKKANEPKRPKRRILVNAKPLNSKIPVTPTSTKPQSAHEIEVRATEYGGFGNFHRPCSFLDAKPGSRVKAYGRPGTVRWGLTNGVKPFILVIEFDEPEEIRRHPGLRSKWEICVKEFCVPYNG